MSPLLGLIKELISTWLVAARGAGETYVMVAMGDRDQERHVMVVMGDNTGSRCTHRLVAQGKSDPSLLLNG